METTANIEVRRKTEKAESSDFVDSHRSVYVSNPIYDRILGGFFSELNNAMGAISLRGQIRGIHHMPEENKQRVIFFLEKLRGHYKPSDAMLVAVEFLLDFFNSYPRVTEEECERVEKAVNEVYDDLGIVRPSQANAFFRIVTAKEKASMNSEAVSLAA